MNKSFNVGHGRVSWLRGLWWCFLVLTCLRVWTGPAPMLEKAQAQIPDAGLQRKQLVEGVQQNTQVLREIRQILGEGTLNVRIQGADNPPGR